MRAYLPDLRLFRSVPAGIGSNQLKLCIFIAALNLTLPPHALQRPA